MVRVANNKGRLSWRAICLALSASATCVVADAAAAERPSVVVLRSDLAASELSDAVDRQLVEALTERADFESTYFSPTPYGDIELAAGCRGPTDECVERVASSLNADWLLVRELRRDATGALVLSLVAKNGAGVEARRTEAPIAAAGANAPARVVQALVSELYDGEAGKENAPPSSRTERGSSALRPVGYSLLGASGALLVAGVAVGVAGRNDHDQYARMDVVDESSARRAEWLLETAQRRTRAANAMLASGAVAGLTGAAFLIWDRLRRHERAQPRMRVGLSASPEGASVQLAGTLWGMP